VQGQITIITLTLKLQLILLYTQRLSPNKSSKRDKSDKSSLTRYSKRTFSSMNFSKEKSRDVNQKLKSSIKKSKSKLGRKTSSKRVKKSIRTLAYSSPSKMATANFSSRVKKNIQQFKKNYFTKSAFDAPSNSQIKNQKNKKSLIRKKKNLGMKQVVASQNIKMRTIDLPSSRNMDDLSESSSNSYIFNPNSNDFTLKKSSTIARFVTNNNPIRNISKSKIKNKKPNQNKTDSLNFYN
jgi:hypothetical protein